MTTAAPLRAGVIGLGIGERHAAGYARDSRCLVTALCDIDPVKLESAAKVHSAARLTTDPSDVLLDPHIDIVSIASYDDVHALQVVTALENGKHVFVEKPLCLSDEEFDRIDAALLRRPDLTLSSNLLLRRAPQFVQLKDRVRRGQFGRLFHFDASYNYGRIQKITEGWRGRIPFYSVSHGGAIHLIDLILWLSGARVTEVTSVGGNVATGGTGFKHPDMVSALLKLTDGSTATVSANFGCVCPHHHSMAVFGTQASFFQDLASARIHSSREADVEPETLERYYSTEAKTEVQRGFIDQIVGHAPPIVSVTDTMDSMAVSLAIERSLTSGVWETVRYSRAGGNAPAQVKTLK